MLKQKNNGARSEDVEQIHVMQWADITANRGGVYEKLRLLFHIPNGGARSKTEGAIFKAMGVKAGVPDLFLPVVQEVTEGEMSALAGGLFIEMKSEGGKVRPNQRQWLHDLVNAGYVCCVCHGAEQAQQCLEEYLEGRLPTYAARE